MPDPVDDLIKVAAEEIDTDITDVTGIPVHYMDPGADIEGASGHQPWILVPGNITVENFVIPTSKMVNGGSYTDDADLFGFMKGDPDNNPDTVEEARLGDTGYRGEGMRGEQAGTSGERQEAVNFAAGTSLDTSTMGIGFLTVVTQNADGTDQYGEKLFFNYSNISAEPSIRISQDNVHHRSDIEVTYNIGGSGANPIDYSSDESSALISKFGWDATLGTGAYRNRIKDGLDRSTNKIVEALITTYPTKLATFPRTAPMRIKKKDFAEISDTEQTQVSPPSGTEAVESAVVTTRATVDGVRQRATTPTIVTGGDY